MAYMETKNCHSCGGKTTHCNGKCMGCERNSENELTAHFESKTTDEKLDYLYMMIRGMQKDQRQKLF